jgi:ribosomal-protein-alanine N-acetyltransferase
MAPTLETGRLVLRPWRDADLEPWAAMNADPRVMEFFPATLDRAESDAQVERVRAKLEADGFGWWALEAKDGPSFAGVICLQRVPYDTPFGPAYEIGWRVAPACWGRGYAPEGARAAAAHAFGVLGLDEVVALTARINVRSRRVMEKLGMTYDPADDFDHPRVAVGHPIRPHVLYRLRSACAGERGRCSAVVGEGA